MANCYCMGPQNGDPLCPCYMRAVQGDASTFVPLWSMAAAPGPDCEDDFNLELSAKWDETMRKHFG